MGDSTVRDLAGQIDADVWYFPSYKIQDIHWKLSTRHLREYDFVALMAGTCDIQYSDHKTMLKHYQKLIDSIKSWEPHIVIVICAILPRVDHTRHGARIIAFNKGLKAKAIDQDLVFLTPYRPLQGRFLLPKAHLYRDNVHPDPSGARKLIDFFRSNLSPRSLRYKLNQIMK